MEVGADQAATLQHQLSAAAAALKKTGEEVLLASCSFHSQVLHKVDCVPEIAPQLALNPLLTDNGTLPRMQVVEATRSAASNLGIAIREASWLALNLSSLELWDSLQLTRFTQCRLPIFVSCAAGDKDVDCSKGGVASWNIMQRTAMASPKLVCVKAFLLIKKIQLCDSLQARSSTSSLETALAIEPIRLAFCHRCDEWQPLNVEGATGYLASRPSISDARRDIASLCAVSVPRLVAPCVLCDAPRNSPPSVFFLPVTCKPLAHNTDFL
jgi:hypothetical protein